MPAVGGLAGLANFPTRLPDRPIPLAHSPEAATTRGPVQTGLLVAAGEQQEDIRYFFLFSKVKHSLGAEGAT